MNIVKVIIYQIRQLLAKIYYMTACTTDNACANKSDFVQYHSLGVAA